MMDQSRFQTIKIYAETYKLLLMAINLSGESMVKFLDRIVRDEYRRLLKGAMSRETK